MRHVLEMRLTVEDSIRWLTDENLRAEIAKRARELAERHGKRVEVYSAEGKIEWLSKPLFATER